MAKYVERCSGPLIPSVVTRKSTCFHLVYSVHAFNDKVFDCHWQVMKFHERKYTVFSSHAEFVEHHGFVGLGILGNIAVGRGRARTVVGRRWGRCRSQCFDGGGWLNESGGVGNLNRCRVSHGIRIEMNADLIIVLIFLYILHAEGETHLGRQLHDSCILLVIDHIDSTSQARSEERQFDNLALKSGKIPDNEHFRLAPAVDVQQCLNCGDHVHAPNHR